MISPIDSLAQQAEVYTTFMNNVTEIKPEESQNKPNDENRRVIFPLKYNSVEKR